MAGELRLAGSDLIVQLRRKQLKKFLLRLRWKPVNCRNYLG